MKLYGIPNCDTVARARKYLDARQIHYDFHDVRADGLDPDVVAAAYAALGASTFNARSPSWRSLTDDQKSALKDGRDFSAAVQTPTVLKRPLVFAGDTITNGFSEDAWNSLFTPNDA